MTSPRCTIVAPGVLHLPLGAGDEAWILDDGSYEADAARDCALNARPEQVTAVLKDLTVEGRPLRLNVLPVLLRWHGEFVVIDPGCGTAYGPGLGRLAARLRGIGVSDDQVRTVFFSHLHLDHIAGALDLAGGKHVFPNARYYAARQEIEFWSNSEPDLSKTKLSIEQRRGILSAFQPALRILKPLFHAFDPGDELLPGVRTVALPGHTPHHVGFEIASANAEVLYVGDAFVDPDLHVVYPDWLTIGDVAPELVPQTRRSVLSRASARRQWLLGYHFPFPGLGTVCETGEGKFQFRLARWDWASL